MNRSRRQMTLLMEEVEDLGDVLGLILMDDEPHEIEFLGEISSPRCFATQSRPRRGPTDLRRSAGVYNYAPVRSGALAPQGS